MIRNFQMTDDQANAIVSVLRQAGNQTTTAAQLESAVNGISAADRENLISQIQSVGVAQTMKNYKPTPQMSTAGLSKSRKQARAQFLLTSFDQSATDAKLVRDYTALIIKPTWCVFIDRPAT